MSFILGLAGGSCSGKTTLARSLAASLGTAASVLLFDDYYHDLSHLDPDARAKVNFDHPDSLDVELFCEHLAALRRGEAVDVPHYDFATHTRPGTTHRVEPAPVVLVDGILLLALPSCREHLDLGVFVDAPEVVRFERRVERDVKERGRDAEGVRRQFDETVAPMHAEFVAPSARHADVLFEHPFAVDDANAAVRSRLETAGVVAL